MKRLITMLLCFVALLALSFPVQASTPGGDTPPLFTRTAISKAPTLLSNEMQAATSSTCSECDGKVTQMTLRYNGTVANADIQVTRKTNGSDVVFEGIVQSGTSFTLIGPAGPNPGFNGTLGTLITITIGGTPVAKFHTSCSAPIGAGITEGDAGHEDLDANSTFTVIESFSQNGGEICPATSEPTCPAGLDIDGQSTGAFVDGEGLFPGVTVSVSGAGTVNGNPRRVMIFNTSAPSSNDRDLGTPNQDFGGPGVGSGGGSGQPGENNTAQGKAIIISQNNNQSDPNDYNGTGTIIFTFDGLVDFDSIALLDVDNSGWTITAKDASGGIIKTVSPNAYGNNSYELVSVDAQDVKSLEVFINNDSGAIVDLFYCSIDLECAANDAPLLDFENLSDPGQAPEPGDELKFTAPFTNNDANATSPATNVEVTVTYPTSQFTYVDGSATGGNSQDASTPGEIVFTINSLAPGATEMLMFNLTVNEGATSGTVTASVTAADEPDLDSTPDNFDVAPSEDDECATPFQNLPVELVSFEAQADGRSATLAWRTASETNNAGFELQHRYLGEAGKASSATFTALAFIEGHGTTEATQDYTFRLEELEPGHHVFRLKQLDYDGTFAYSPEIEVAIDLPEAYLVSDVYPNPFNPQASFSFSVSRSQEVSVAVYNMLGQRVALLFEGVVSEGTSRTLQIDGSALQSGTYLVRVLGESFVNTQTITLVK